MEEWETKTWEQYMEQNGEQVKNNNVGRIIRNEDRNLLKNSHSLDNTFLMFYPSTDFIRSNQFSFSKLGDRWSYTNCFNLFYLKNIALYSLFRMSSATELFDTGVKY